MSSDSGIQMRVWVEDAWGPAVFVARPDWTVARVKSEALRRAAHAESQSDDFEVKLRGAALLDEARTLAELGVPDLAPFAVLSARRRPVR